MTTFGCNKEPQYTICETAENLWAEWLQSGDKEIERAYFAHTKQCDKCFVGLKSALADHKRRHPEIYNQS